MAFVGICVYIRFLETDIYTNYCWFIYIYWASKMSSIGDFLLLCTIIDFHFPLHNQFSRIGSVIVLSKILLFIL